MGTRNQSNSIKVTGHSHWGHARAHTFPRHCPSHLPKPWAHTQPYRIAQPLSPRTHSILYPQCRKLELWYQLLTSSVVGAALTWQLLFLGHQWEVFGSETRPSLTACKFTVCPLVNIWSQGRLTGDTCRRTCGISEHFPQPLIHPYSHAPAPRETHIPPALQEKWRGK